MSQDFNGNPCKNVTIFLNIFPFQNILFFFFSKKNPFWVRLGVPPPPQFGQYYTYNVVVFIIGTTTFNIQNVMDFKHPKLHICKI